MLENHHSQDGCSVHEYLLCITFLVSSFQQLCTVVEMFCVQAGPKEEKPQSMGVMEEKIVDGLSELKKEKHCEVRLHKLNKVHLEKKATQGSPGSGVGEGLFLCEIEVILPDGL